MRELNLPDEFSGLEKMLIDCDSVGETAYMMPMTQLQELLTALSEARDEQGRLIKGISKLHKLVPCNGEISSEDCEFCKIFDVLHYRKTETVGENIHE